MENMDSKIEKHSVSEPEVGYNPQKDFTTLKAWKKSRELKLFFYNKILTALPKEERYSLASQIRRASISITANIAEGYGRFHYQEGIQFYRIARGSMYELKDHLISCVDLKLINRDLYNDGIDLLENAKKILNGYISYTKHRKLKS